MLSLTLLAASCNRAEHRPHLEVVHQFFPGPEARVGASLGCAIDDEIRRVRACTARVEARFIADTSDEGGDLTHVLQVPENFRGVDCILERRYRPKSSHGPWSALSPIRIRPSNPTVKVSLPARIADDEPARVLVTLVRVPPSRQSFETRPVEIGPGAVLVGGLGVVPMGRVADMSPVEFRVTARTATEDRVLVDRVVDPAAKGAQRWVDYRVDLGSLAGQEARFAFARRTRYRAKAAGVSIPVWSSAGVLEPSRDRDRRNVLVISLDTLRADYVGTYGSRFPTTPVMDAVAREGVVFEETIAPFPSTTASHASMLTGLYASAHTVYGPTRQLPPEVPTLAEILARHGYQTAAVTEDGMLAAAVGFPRGFNYYRETKAFWGGGNARETVDAALAWLERHRDEKFFLFVHTYEVHDVLPRRPGVDAFNTYVDDGTERPITAETPEPIRRSHAYAADVAYTDAQVQRLLDGLAELGEGDRTILVITSDHGEAFNEHGFMGHTWTLYDEVLRVPLILRAPGLIPGGMRVETPVSLVDLSPTILDLLGIPVPRPIQGRSLLPLITQGNAASLHERALYAEMQDRVAIRKGSTKWIVPGSREQRPEVFDVQTDPGEKRDVGTPALWEQGRMLRKAFADQSAKLRPGAEATAPVTLDERTREKLRALGYADE